MQNKPTTQASEIQNDQEALTGPSEAAPVAVEEEDPIEAEFKLEALKAAQDAVSKQKKITSAFDDDCLKLRPPEEAPIAGSSNIDLLHP